MPWSFRRIAAIISVTAATIAITRTFLPTFDNQMLEAFYGAVDRVLGIRTVLNVYFTQFIGFRFGPIEGLGDVLLIVLLAVILGVLLHEREPRVERKVEEIKGLVRDLKEKTREGLEAEEEAKAAEPVQTPYIAVVPIADQSSQGSPSRAIQFSASAVINAPRGEVWELLSESSCVPAFQEILKSLEVLGQVANAITWQGKVEVGSREFPVEGTTTLYPPSRLEVLCTQGALQGLRGFFTLTEVPEGTKVTEKAEVDPALIPPEYSPVVAALTTRGSEILAEDLERFRQLVEARGSGDE
jgi:uncharacterized membrane protein